MMNVGQILIVEAHQNVMVQFQLTVHPIQDLAPQYLLKILAELAIPIMNVVVGSAYHKKKLNVHIQDIVHNPAPQIVVEAVILTQIVVTEIVGQLKTINVPHLDSVRHQLLVMLVEIVLQKLIAVMKILLFGNVNRLKIQPVTANFYLDEKNNFVILVFDFM